MKQITLTGIIAALGVAGVTIIYFLEPRATSVSLSKITTSAPSEKKHSSRPAQDFSSNITPSEKPTPPLLAQPTPTDQPVFEVSTPTQVVRASDIIVPHGARVPAVLMDGGGPDDSPETQAIMNGMIEEFAEKIQEAKRTNRNMDEAWEEAREAADDRYRQFFGFEAFNAATLEAAGDAYEEATAATPQTVP
jgi:hypothetical protein